MNRQIYSVYFTANASEPSMSQFVGYSALQTLTFGILTAFFYHLVKHLITGEYSWYPPIILLTFSRTWCSTLNKLSSKYITSTRCSHSSKLALD